MVLATSAFVFLQCGLGGASGTWVCAGKELELVGIEEEPDPN
jgi:hypothetical protein